MIKIKNIVVLLLVVYAIVATFFRAPIDVAYGYGWDGLNYGTTATMLPDKLENKELDGYFIQRVVPSAIAYVIYSFVPEHQVVCARDGFVIDPLIVQIFKGMNLVFLLAAFFFWHKILAFFSFDPKVYIGSYLLLFVNFILGYDYFFEVVSTDQSAFFLSVLLLYLYLRHHHIGLLVVSAIGAFTWPIFLYLGLLLYVFPYGRSFSMAIGSRIRIVSVIAIVIAYLLGCGWILWAPLPNIMSESPIVSGLLFLSIPLSAAFVAYFAFCYFLPWEKTTSLEALSSWVVRLLPSIFLVVAVWWMQREYSQPSDLIYQKDGLEISYSGYFLYSLFKLSFDKPLNFLVAHIHHFGLLFLFFLLRLKFIARQLHGQWGVGAYLLLGLFGALSLNSESRQLIVFLPFMAVWVTQSCQALFTTSALWVMGGINLVLAKWYVPFNRFITFPDFCTEPKATLQFANDYPIQYWSMNFGPWINTSMYLLFLAVLIPVLWYAVRLVQRLPTE